MNLDGFSVVWIAILNEPMKTLTILLNDRHVYMRWSGILFQIKHTVDWLIMDEIELNWPVFNSSGISAGVRTSVAG